ncbi:unnamed protein product [marine sediment metagenome]|uniref:Uncharacterized protein n=1 Tax=marine sediment metagenome TaxID=412755 RepID=X1RHJ1_9ZZZZ
MSSSSYTRLDLALHMSLLNLVTLELLRIVSIEYTVLRDKGQPDLLQVQILLCEAEQKEDLTYEEGLQDVKKALKPK